MASHDGIPITDTDVLVDFQSGRMLCTLPKGILEVVVMVICDWGQAKIIEDRFCKSNTTRLWTRHFVPHHITMQRCWTC